MLLSHLVLKCLFDFEMHFKCHLKRILDIFSSSIFFAAAVNLTSTKISLINVPYYAFLPLLMRLSSDQNRLKFQKKDETEACHDQFLDMELRRKN